MNTAKELNKPFENEVNLRRQYIYLKSYQPLEFMLYFEKGNIARLSLVRLPKQT